MAVSRAMRMPTWDSNVLSEGHMTLRTAAAEGMIAQLQGKNIIGQHMAADTTLASQSSLRQQAHVAGTTPVRCC